ncbi:nucleolin-like [Stegodyphus dumicola]|uniref:nucleolin-like n=1 Tax=Stegodyphus dumicola TaxID=202533 RepID=UPI0015A88DAF|nr:nucleolin-like [Stegodyphus dumicola]
MNIFCAISVTKVYGPFFFMEKTVTGITYLDMHQNWLFPQIEDDSDDFIFVQDGTPPLPGIFMWTFAPSQVTRITEKTYRKIGSPPLHPSRITFSGLGRDTIMKDFQGIKENENQLKKTVQENYGDTHDDLELDLDDDNLDVDDHDHKDDADTNHGAHDDDVDEDGDDADDDMDQDHDIDDDDNHNANGAAADDNDTPEANENGDNDVDQDDVVVVDEDHVNEDDVDDNEDDDDDSHEANDNDDVDNDPRVQNTEETMKNKLNQFEQACADQANEKTPAKKEIPKAEKNPRKLLVFRILVEAFEAIKNAGILGEKLLFHTFYLLKPKETQEKV